MWACFEVLDVGWFWPQTVLVLVSSSLLIFESLIVFTKTTQMLDRIISQTHIGVHLCGWSSQF